MHNNNGSLSAINSVLEFDETCEFIDNILKVDGGAIAASQSTILFKATATVEIYGNRARNGGGLLLLQTQLDISCEVGITGNTAMYMGGGLCAYRSKVSFEKEVKTLNKTNNEEQNGGGAALIASTLNVYHGIMTFHNNTAHQRGGAVHMEHTSTLNVHLPQKIQIVETLGWVEVSSNSALYGGGFYADDETAGSTQCELQSTIASGIQECFFHGISVIQLHYSSINFQLFFMWKVMISMEGYLIVVL